jgi:flagellar biosynthesis/type III secretory pathway M-ring protein FliF/YscJ
MPHFLNVLHKMPRSDQLIMLAAAAASLFVIIAAVVVVLSNPSVQPYGGELGPSPK